MYQPIVFANNVGLYINSQQTICWHTHCILSLFGSQWFGVFWQRCSGKLRYIWQWALKISWQPWLAPWHRPCAACSEERFFLRIMIVTFLQISRKPPLWSWTWQYHQKANEKTLPIISWAYGNTVNFSHTNLIHFCLTMSHWNEWGKTLQNLPKPLSLVARWPPSNTPMPGWPHLPPQTTARSVHALPHNCATKSPLVTAGYPKFTPKTVPSPLTIITLI